MTRIPLPSRLGPASIAALADALSDADGPVVLEGSCSGLDIEALVAADFDAAAVGLEAFAALLDQIHAHPFPVLAVVDGPTFGGGVGLVAASDVVFASPDARFGLPEVFLGLTPATVWPWIRRRVGPVAARRFALGEPAVSAEGALGLGLVDAVHTDLARATRKQLARWERAEPQALQAVKALEAQTQNEARTAWQHLANGPAARERCGREAAGEVPWES